MANWKPAYLLDIESMDRQHEEMFRIAGDLYDSIGDGRGKEAISAILDRLIKYTGDHFEAEEGLMRDSGYLELAEHTAEHRQFTQKLLEIQNAFRKGQRGLTLEVLCVLRDWCETHIHDRDSQYGPLVRTQLAALKTRSGENGQECLGTRKL